MPDFDPENNLRIWYPVLGIEKQKPDLTDLGPKFRVVSIMDCENFLLPTILIARGTMELEKLERQLEILAKKNKKYFEKDRVIEKRAKSVQELDPNSLVNRKREIFRQICQIQFDLTSYEFFNKLVDHAMAMSEDELEQILK